MITKETLTVKESSSFLGLHQLDGVTNYIFMVSIEVFNHLDTPIILKKGEFNVFYFDTTKKDHVATRDKAIEIDPGKMYKFKIGLQLASDTAFVKGKLTLCARNGEKQTKIILDTMYLASNFSQN